MSFSDARGGAEKINIHDTTLLYVPQVDVGDLVQQSEEDAVELGDPARQADDGAKVIEEGRTVDLAVVKPGRVDESNPDRSELGRQPEQVLRLADRRRQLFGQQLQTPSVIRRG